jgi:hypothetical protein
MGCDALVWMVWAITWRVPRALTLKFSWPWLTQGVYWLTLLGPQIFYVAAALTN